MLIAYSHGVITPMTGSMTSQFQEATNSGSSGLVVSTNEYSTHRSRSMTRRSVSTSSLASTSPLASAFGSLDDLLVRSLHDDFDVFSMDRFEHA